MHRKRRRSPVPSGESNRRNVARDDDGPYPRSLRPFRSLSSTVCRSCSIASNACVVRSIDKPIVRLCRFNPSTTSMQDRISRGYDIIRGANTTCIKIDKHLCPKTR